MQDFIPMELGYTTFSIQMPSCSPSWEPRAQILLDFSGSIISSAIVGQCWLTQLPASSSSSEVQNGTELQVANHVASFYFLSFLLCLFLGWLVCLQEGWYVHAVVYVCRLEDNFQDSVLSFHQLGPRYPTQITRLSSNHIYSLSHLASPWFLDCPWPTLVEPRNGHQLVNSLS